jgi:hypothetical protein
MEFYTVIGLQKSQQTGNTYVTDERGRILHDENGLAKTVSCTFDHDTLFVHRDDTYYAIRLFMSHGASFGRRASLTQTGHMDVEIVDSVSPSQLTHVPLRNDLAFHFHLPMGICDFEDDMDVYSHQVRLSESDGSSNSEWIFRFSHVGGNEAIPYGYADINLELFREIPSQGSILWTRLIPLLCCT